MSNFVLNGASRLIPSDPDLMLVDYLRGEQRLTGTKLVCGAGVCGACTVLVDGQSAVSCLLPVQHLSGKSVTTVEHVGVPSLHPVQKAFMAHDALQCGFCTPGFIMEAVAFHDRWRASGRPSVPDRAEIGEALSGHLCRCGAYDAIYRALAEACTGRFDADEVASPRVEARSKVTGIATYTVDVKHEGQLVGLLLRSPHAHAKIVGLDCSAAVNIPGVKAALPLVQVEAVVRYAGAPLAAIAAVDRATALRGLAAIEVAFDVRPAAVGIDAAGKADAAIVFDAKQRKSADNVSEGSVMPARWDGNIRGPSAAFSTRAKRARREIAASRAARDPLLVEGVFRTAGQSHTCLEPHAAVARFDGDKLTVHASTQAVFHLRELIAKRYGMALDRVHVLAEHVGGGFGSKASLSVEITAAIDLARVAGAPVGIVYERHEELSVAGYRPGSHVDIALLPSADGRLKALSLSARSDGGAAVNSTIAALARLIYPADAKDLADYDVVSHLPPGSPFRGPGGPPMAFALEQAVDEAAIRLKIDPIALRRRWDPNPNRQRLYDWAAGLDLWRSATPAATKSGRFRRGVGVASGYWLYLWQPGSKVQVAVESGRLVVRTAVQDIGQGIRTVIADTVAREFGLEPAEIDVRIGDSGLPEGPGSGGSRTTASVVPPTLLAVQKLKDAIESRAGRKASPGSNAPWRELIASSPDIQMTAERPEDSRDPGQGIRSPLKDAGLMGTIFGWMLRRFSNLAVGAGTPSSVQIVEVEVDTLLGHIRVLRVATGIAVGKVAAPALARSQAAGSVIQGIGFALYEGREVDVVTGRILSAGLDDYRLPGIADTPLIDVHFDEGGFDHVLGGSVGIGEVATVPTSAALANAVHNALGVRPHQIPLRPDRVLALLNQRSAA